MSLPVRLLGLDQLGNIKEVTVTSTGELAVAPLFFDEASYNELDVINTAYNFYGPRAGEQFVITNLIMSADKGVSGTTDADVIVYEASSADTTTEDKILIHLTIGQSQNLSMPVQYLLVNEGAFINAKTSDDDVHLNILGHYIPRIE